MAGILAARRTVPTKNGDRMQFVTLEDETGFANLILTPPVFEENRPLAVAGGALDAEGVVQSQEGVIHLKVDRPLRPLSETVDVSLDALEQSSLVDSAPRARCG